MKKFIFTLSCILAFTAVYSQTISFSPREISKGAPNMEDPNGNYNVETSSRVTNNSADAADSMFTWTVIEVSQPAGWKLDICDPIDCRYDIQQNQAFSLKMRKGTNGFFKVDYMFNNVSGAGSCKVAIVCTTNPAIADTLTVHVNGWVTGLNDVNKVKPLGFYPNPVKDQLNLKFQSKADITVEVYNILGSRVKTFVHSGMQSQTNISDLQNGVYFIRFMENGKLYTKQFTKAE